MEKFLEFCKQYKWRLIGVTGGILFCILVFTINFWRTLLLMVLGGAGYVIGLALDNGGKERVSEFIDRLFRKKS
ncbi:MAG: DUF2273 domain-containing protein [Christensenellaceae bacterium]|nr:DUF2273 domain-containing protein [Christensenellaceae bacterium]